MLRKGLVFALAGVAAVVVMACEGVDSIDGVDADAISLTAEADDLWSGLTVEGSYLLSQVFSAEHDDFTRVAVRFDSEAPTEVEVRVRDGVDDGWSDWKPIDITFREGIAHNGHVDLDRGSAQLQLRVRGERPEQISFLAVQAFDASGQEAVDDRVLRRGVEGSDIASAGSVDVSRGEWGALPTRCTTSLGEPFRVAIHHTDTPNNDSLSVAARMRQMQSFHMHQRGFCDLGYHYVIGRDGRVYQGRPASLRGAHVGGANTGNVGISMMGSYGSSLPTPAMLDRAASLLADVTSTHGLALSRDVVQGHGEWQGGATACPGNRLLSHLDALVTAAGGANPSPPSARFIMPVGPGGVVLDDHERHFGACRSASGGSNSDCTRSHLGVDIHAHIGEPVYAAADGVVVELSTNSGAGLYVNISHADGYVTRYLHLDRTRGVAVGSQVVQGQRIGDVGETGRAGSGPHLHFEVLQAGSPIDPAPLIGWHDLPRVDSAPRGRVDNPPEGDHGGGERGLLNPGDRGVEVYRLQHLLEAWRPGIMGGNLGGINTATYGPRTLEAVHEAARELRGHANPSSDYTVGPLFWGALRDAVHARFSGSRSIRYLDTGADVYRLQHALEAWRPGVLNGSLGAIGTARYGPRTLDAVHVAARELRGHQNPSDTYVVGPLFWGALLSAIHP
jgi:hypothetical protein